MNFSTKFLAFLILLICCVEISVADNCTSSFKDKGTKPTGSIKLISAVKNCYCEWSLGIVANASMNHTAFFFDKLNLHSDDKLIIKDGNNSIDIPHEDNFIYIAFEVNSTLVLNCSSDDFNRNFQASYNSQNCMITATEMFGIYRAPKISKGVLNANCTYTLSFKNTHQYVSIDDFNIGDNTLEIFDGHSTKSTRLAKFSGSQKIPDTICNSQAVTLLLKVKDSQEKIEFLIEHEAISSGCSKNYNLLMKDAKRINSVDFPLDTALNVMDCRMIVKAPENQKMQISFEGLKLAKISQSFEIRDGNRKDSEILATVTNKTYSFTQRILSSGSYLYIRFMSESLEPIADFSIIVNKTQSGGLIRGNGTFKLMKHTVVPSTLYFFQVISDPSKQAKLVISHQSTKLSNSSKLWIYDGFDEGTSTLLDVLGSDRLYDVYSTNNKLMAVARNFVSNDIFEATTSSIPLHHAYISVESSGIKSLTSSEVGTYLWRLRPYSNSKTTDIISLRFIDLDLKGNDSVIIYTLSNLKKPLFTFDSATVNPANFYIPRLDGVEINSLRSYQYPKPVIVSTLSYNVKPSCSNELDLSTTRFTELFSPNFPNQYPLLANCETKFLIPNGKGIYIKFSHMDTLENHPVIIHSDKKDAHYFTGSELPNDVLIHNSKFVKITFNSENITNGPIAASGFKIMVSLIDCGDILNASSAVIKTPNYPKKVSNKLFCVWSVTVPWNGKEKGSHQYLSFSTNINFKNDSNFVYEIVEGPSTRGNILQNVTVKNGGETTKNQMIVVYNNIAGKTQEGLSLKYQASSCNKDNQCGDGTCIHKDWVCDGKVQCDNGKDELGCETKTKTEYVSRGVASYALAIAVLVSLAIGAAMAILIPKIYYRHKNQGVYNSFSNIPVVID